MNFVQHIPFRREGRNYVLTLDRSGNFISQEEVVGDSFEEIDAERLLRQFFGPDPVTTPRTRNLQERFRKAVTALLAEGVSPLEVWEFFLNYEGAALVQAAGERGIGSIGVRRIASRFNVPLALGSPVPPRAPATSGGRSGPSPVASRPPAEHAVVERFLRADAPCFFGGCEGLRAELSAAIDAAGGVQCPGCTRSQLEAQFAERALAAWKSQTKQDENPPTTPSDSAGDHVVSDDVVQS
jgi:hypothetical protein